MIRALLFDMGNTIVPFDFRRGYERLEKLCPLPAAEIPVRLRRGDLVHRFETGRIEPREFVARLCAELEMTMTYADFRELWSSIFLPGALIPDPLLAALARRYRMVLVSNTNPIHFEMARANYPGIERFHDFVLSYEVGALKPSPGIYRFAIQRAQCPAGECFFVDDLQPCVDGALREGIDAVRFESREQLERDLKARGVRW